MACHLISETDLSMPFEEHDFFSTNPIENADVFMLKYVIHDWSHQIAVEILKRLREVATSNTKLILLDKVIPHMCPLSEIEESTIDISVPGFLKPNVPEPIIHMSGNGHMSSMVVRAYKATDAVILTLMERFR